MTRDLIQFALSNFTLTFFVAGVICVGVCLLRAPKPVGPAVLAEKLLFWFVFWTIGVSYFYNFVFHTFFGKMAAAFIGWADSPFQAEVGWASLGFSVVGLLAAFRRSFDMRLAAILDSGVFTLGAATGHIQQMIAAHNFAPGKCGRHLLERYPAAARGLPASAAEPANRGALTAAPLRCGERLLDVGQRKIVALEQERRAESECCGIGKAIAEIQLCGMA